MNHPAHQPGDETIYILVPAHNRARITVRFAECLAKQTYRNFRLVLIDDGSTDGTAEQVKQRIPDATVLRGDGNLWWAGSLDYGREWLLRTKRANPDELVLIINDDTAFEPEFLERARLAMSGKSRTLMLAAQYSRQKGAFVEIGVHADWASLTFTSAATPEEVNCLSTRGLFLRVRDMEEIGGFRPCLLPHYGSDYEYTMRAFRKGFTFLSDRKVRIWDDEEQTGIRSTERRSGWQLLRMMFAKRNLRSPWYWTMFIVLACPARYWPRNITRVWRTFLAELLDAHWTNSSAT